MDLVSVSKYFPSIDLFLIGIGIGKRKDLNFDYKFKDDEKIALQKFIQQLAKGSVSKFQQTLAEKIPGGAERQLNLF